MNHTTAPAHADAHADAHAHAHAHAHALPPTVVRPWWRYGMLWMVIGGPLVVVVAATVTAVIAFRGADPVVRTAPATSLAAEEAFDLQPAMQGRNHAATGVAPAAR